LKNAKPAPGRYGSRQLFELPTSVIADLFKEQAELDKNDFKPFGIIGTSTQLKPLQAHEIK